MNRARKLFSVVLSMALCFGMTAPAFAASFTDLQDVVNDNGRYEGTEILRDGDVITLNGDVVRETGESGISITKDNGGITIDLNGHKIDGNGEAASGAVISVNGGDLTIRDSTAYDDDGVRTGAGDGQITGGNNVNGGKTQGGGIYIASGTVVLDSGNITDNAAKTNGGGVALGANGKQGAGSDALFIMDGGSISGNIAGSESGDGGGGGVWVKNGAQFVMNGGEITGNSVTDNKGSGNGGGVAIHQGEFAMTGGEIYDNDAPRGTGVLINAGDKTGGNAGFVMTGGYVSGKDDTSCIYMEESNGYDAVLTLQDKAVLDGSIFLGEGASIVTDNVKQPDGAHVYTGFDMTDVDGANAGVIGADDTAGSGYEAVADSLLYINYEHVWKNDWQSDGADTHSCFCEYCSEKGVSEEHAWDNGVVIMAPTATEDGKMVFTCGGCGETRTEVLPATGGTGPDIPPVIPEGPDVPPVNPGGPGGSGDSGNTGDSEKPETPDVPGGEKPVVPGTDIDPDDTVIEDPAVPTVPLPDVFPGDDGQVDIEDEAIPLAGLLTRGDVIGYLWQKAGRPDGGLSDFNDVPADHEWAAAIGWAQTVGVAMADLDGNFRPDDLVVRWTEDLLAAPEGEFQEFLNRYAVVAGIELLDGELFIELGGKPGDIIMGEDAQVIFDDFFAKLAAALDEAA